MRSRLPLEVVTRILCEAHELGARKVALTGGEPLVYPRLLEVLRTASGYSLTTSLYTTGIKDNDLDPIDKSDASSLISSGLGRIIFSVYAARPEIHNAITGFPSLGPTVVAVQNCIGAGVHVEFHFVPLRENYLQLGEVVRLAQELNVPKVSVLRFVPHGRGAMIRDTEELSPEEYERFGELVQEVSTPGPVQVRLGAPMNMLGISHACCDAAQDIVVIDHRGQVFPCDAFKGTDYADREYGSILHKPLPLVWARSGYLKAARDMHVARRNGCASCPTSCMAQEAVRLGGLQNLVHISVAKVPGSSPALHAGVVEMKVGSAR